MEPLLPTTDGKRGGQFRDHRVIIEAIAWRFRTGSPWRDLPERFGAWQTAWRRHDEWSRNGTWHRLLAAAQADADAEGTLGWMVSVDSSIVRAHQHAAGARSGVRGARPNHTKLAPERPDHALGRSRGGLSTKIHLATDTFGRPLSLWLTPGQTSDTTQLARVLDGIRVPRVGAGRPRTRPDRVIADKGYSSRANRALLSGRGIRVTIPERDDQKGHRRRRGSAGGRPYTFDPMIYRDRVVERCFNVFKQWRGIAARFDKKATNFLGGLTLAAALMWLRT